MLCTYTEVPVNHCSVITPGLPVLCSYSVFSAFAAIDPPFMADEKLRMFGFTSIPYAPLQKARIANAQRNTSISVLQHAL